MSWRVKLHKVASHKKTVGRSWSKALAGRTARNILAGRGLEASEIEQEMSFLDVIPEGDWVKKGSTVEILNFDENDDTIIFAYDPDINTSPEFSLLDGENPGDKFLMMDGIRVVLIEKASSLKLSDIVMIETPLAA